MHSLCFFDPFTFTPPPVLLCKIYPGKFSYLSQTLILNLLMKKGRGNMLVWCFIRNRKIEHNKISRQFGRNTLFHFLWKAMWAKYCDPCQSLTFDKVDNGIIKRRFPPPPAPALAQLKKSKSREFRWWGFALQYNANNFGKEILWKMQI